MVAIGHKLILYNTIHLGLSLGKTVYSILPQSTQLQNGYLAIIRQCLELVHYMLRTALEYPSGDEIVSACTGLLGDKGRVST